MSRKEEEKEKYDYLYANNYPPGGGNLFDWSRSMGESFDGKSVNDFGCGWATLRSKANFSRYVGMDIAAKHIEKLRAGITDVTFVCSALPDTESMPMAEIGWCSDVLEHLPEDLLTDSIVSMLGKSEVLWLLVSCRPSGLFGQNGENLHLTVKDSAWWAKKISEVGQVVDSKENVSSQEAMFKVVKNGEVEMGLSELQWTGEISGLSARQTKAASHYKGKPHEFGKDWWQNPKCPKAFKYASLDELYGDDYYDGSEHLVSGMAEDLYFYMQEIYARVIGREFESIVEYGTGCGEITSRWHKYGLDFLAIEGSLGGVKKLRRIGIPEERIIHCDLRRLPVLPGSFDLAMCTEVIEHVEPFFASKVISDITRNSNVIWFSAATPDQDVDNFHYHHANEKPIEAWDNLFAFLGFSVGVELDKRYGRASRLYIRDGWIKK